MRLLSQQIAAAAAPILALCSILGQAATAQELPEQQGLDWRMPFRNPAEDRRPPTELFRAFQDMHARALRPDVRKTFNDAGIEICDDDAWRAAFARMQTADMDAGWVSQIIRLSANATDRRLAFYGMFYHQDTSIVMQMLNHVPGEPLMKIRQESYPRAMEFLKVHFPSPAASTGESTDQGSSAPKAEGQPANLGKFAYQFDAAPYFALLAIDSPTDQLQALWFLRGVVALRPQLWKTYFHTAGPSLYRLIVSDDPTVRETARDFIQALDPNHHPVPETTSSAKDLTAYLDAVFYDVFPPIRPISPGLVAMFNSADLDEIIRLGKEMLEDGSAGDSTNGKLKTGGYYRGIEIARVPAPIDKLGIKLGWIVTAINGTPVANCAEMLAALRAHAHTQSMLVEYVLDGKQQAKEFRREG